MEQKIFSVQGMTCTSCSNTIYNGLSKRKGIETVSVCLLSEKLIVKGTNLVAEEIIELVEMFGFEVITSKATEIREAHVLQGELTFKLSEAQNCLDQSFLKINGVLTVDQLASDLIHIKFNPEAITARQLAYRVEDTLKCKVVCQQDASTKMSILDQQQKSMNEWLNEFTFSLIFTVPIFLLSMVVTRVISDDDLVELKCGDLPMYNILLWVLATPVQFFFGARFYKGAYKSLLQKTANMDVLIVMGTSAAYFYGSSMNILYAIGFKEPTSMNYIESTHSFETSALLISIVLLGKYIESRSKHRTTDAVTRLAKLQISSAICVDGGFERETDVELLEVGCFVKVYPGCSIPVDGMIEEGEAWINESMMTGESSLVVKHQGQFVFGGTVCAKGCIQVKVTKVGKDTALNQIISLVESAQSTKPHIQAFADRISSWFVPLVVSFATVTWIIWFALIYGGNQRVAELIGKNGSPFIFGFNFGISVLVIACPCALGLATPTAVMVATGVAARYGILIKGGNALEASANIKTLVFDKTGTLTEGKPVVKHFKTYKDQYSDEVIKSFISAIERKSEHPIAKSICGFIDMPEARCEKFENIEGEGVIGSVEWQGEKLIVRVGNEGLMKSGLVDIGEGVRKKYEKYENEGNTVILASVNRKVVAVISMAESELVKPEAPWVVSELHQMGIDVWMITGDNAKAAYKVAESLNIPKDRVLANCYPADKKIKVEELQGHYDNDKKNSSTYPLIGKKVYDNTELNEVLLPDKKEIFKVPTGFRGVMFVGDGINDSPSLAQADIGIAVGGTDIANEAASVVLLKTDLRDVLITLDLSKKALSKIKWNFFWAFIYNILGIPLAGGILYIWVQVHITSIMAAAAMACSSTAVVLSSLMLNSYRPPSENH